MNTEEAGSRIAVIEGEVRVEHAGAVRTLLPGQQVATNPLMKPYPVSEELAWSREAQPHLTLMQQTAPASRPATPELKFETASLRFTGVGGSPFGTVECGGIDGVWSVATDVTLNPIPVAAGPDASPTPLGRCVGSAFIRVYLAAAYDIRMDRISGDSP